MLRRGGAMKRGPSLSAQHMSVEAGGSFFPTKAWCVFDEENGLSALKIVIGF